MSAFVPILRSGFLWTISVVHFVPATLALLLLRIVMSPSRLEPALRLYCRNIVRLAGIRLEVRRAAGFDPERPCLFAANHVNVFDPFVLYAAIPQLARGLELESHFSIPVYGWLMHRFGVIPVPNRLSREGLERLERNCHAALAAGTSLVVFPEGTRTRTGRVGPFRRGMFRIAVSGRTALTPVTMVGSHEFQQVNGWRLTPGRVVVHLHDTIDAADHSPAELCDAVQAIVSEPI